MSDDERLRRIIEVKDKYEHELLRKKNVVGVGVGFRQRGGRQTDEMVLTVMVRYKLPPHRLRQHDRIPSELEGVPVDVQEVGTLRAL